MPVTVIEDESSMQTQLQKAGGKLVVVDFTATWCGPCKQMAPFFEELSKKYPQTVFLKVDVDENSEIAMQYEVSAMPTFLFIRKQKEIDRVMGADPVGLENRIHSWGGPITSSQPAISNSQVPPPLPPPLLPPQQQMYSGPIMDTGTVTHREPSSTSNNQQQFGMSQNLSLPSNHNHLSGTQMTNMNMQIPMVPPSQNLQGLNNYNQLSQNGANLNVVNMQQPQPQQQIYPNFLPSYPPPPTQQNFYPQPQQQQPQQQQQQQIQSQQPYPIIHQSNAGYGNANNQALVIANPEMQYEETTNNIGHLGRDFRSNNSNNSTDENNDSGPDQGQRDDKDGQDLEREENGRMSSTITAAPTTKEKKEPRKRSSHRTRSTHRKDSHHSSSANNQQNIAKINKDNETHAQKALRVKKKLPTSTIQIRLSDGTKLSANLNTTQPVSKIREFINNARPGYSNKPFVLMTIFPSREITNEDQSIQDAKLQNSIVVQRLT